MWPYWRDIPYLAEKAYDAEYTKLVLAQAVVVREPRPFILYTMPRFES